MLLNIFESLLSSEDKVHRICETDTQHLTELHCLLESDLRPA